MNTIILTSYHHISPQQNKISTTNSKPLPPTATAATQTKSSQAVLSRWNIVQQEIYEN